MHWHNDRSVHHLLDVLERVNRETPIAPLRWSIAHLNDASPESLSAMKALGVGWLMQNAMYSAARRSSARAAAKPMRSDAADRDRAQASASRSAAAPTRTA